MTLTTTPDSPPPALPVQATARARIAAPGRLALGMATLVGLLALIPTAEARVEPQTADEQPIVPKKQQDEVTIVQDGDKLMEIHQVNGRVYGIKVTPKHGKPYYLVDAKGDGKFIQSQDERMLVPQWVIFSW